MAEAPGRFKFKRIGPPNTAITAATDFTWELVTTTGQVIARSGSVMSRSEALQAVEWIKENVGACPNAG
jgi:uncharacterized protein YegP (UPF0339 family)